MGYAEVVDEPLGVEDVERDLLEPKTAAVVFAGWRGWRWWRRRRRRRCFRTRCTIIC